VESKYSSLVRAWDSYEAAYVTYYADESRALDHPTKFQASYTVKRKLEIWEFALVTYNIPISKSLMRFGSVNMSTYSMVFS